MQDHGANVSRRDVLGAATIGALLKYRSQILSAQLAILNDSSDGLESISVYFSSLVGLYTSGKVPPKCLMAATISEFGRNDPEVLEITGGYLTDLDRGFLAALGRARELREISELGQIPALAKLLAGLAQGLAIVAAVANTDTLNDLVSQVVVVLNNK